MILNFEKKPLRVSLRVRVVLQDEVILFVGRFRVDAKEIAALEPAVEGDLLLCFGEAKCFFSLDLLVEVESLVKVGVGGGGEGGRFFRWMIIQRHEHRTAEVDDTAEVNVHPCEVSS